MSPTLEFWLFLVLMGIYSILPISVLRTRKIGLESTDPIMTRCRGSWWNRQRLLHLTYVAWLVTPISLTIMAAMKFLKGEHPARAVFTEVSELAKKHVFVSVLWEGVVAGACGLLLLQFLVSERNGLDRLRVWCTQHSNEVFIIAFLIGFVGQLALISF